MLIVLTGKTASGKDTIGARLLSKYPNLKKIVTTTSRVPRDGETQGVEYYFLSRSGFESKVQNGEFAEYVEYGGNLYGTYKKELEQAKSQDALWRIDPSRAGAVRDFLSQNYPDQKVLVIYITVSDDTVLQRLQKRGLAESEIQKRMTDDKNIWEKYKDSYDFIVENVPNKLEEAVDKIDKILADHDIA